MALDDLELSLMAFPQRWAGGGLTVNLLMLPVGDPTQPLGSGPAFAGAAVHLIANLSADAGALPSTATVPTATQAFTATPPPVAPLLFPALAKSFTDQGIPVTSAKLTSVTDVRIKKSLPPSYTNAIPFETPRSADIVLGDGYCCALRDQAPAVNSPPIPPDDSIAWGQILSFALRQPALAVALGLVHPITIPVPGTALDSGGWIYFTLDTTVPHNSWVTDWQANPDAVRSFAARLPAVGTTARPLFAATLIPILTTPGASLAEAQREAEIYDDGFAQVVHCNQPKTIDAATLQPDMVAPGTDAGIQLGWDDEQVTIWFNQQLDLLRARVSAPADGPAEAPLGVQGYRVDVRVRGESAWCSLCTINGTVAFSQTAIGQPLGPGGPQAGPPATTSLNNTELWTAPAPVRPSTTDNTTNAEDAWLPLYFALWAGSSLVLPDPVVALLAAGASITPPQTAIAAPAKSPNPRPDLTGVPILRYGTDYEFRVRLVDLTGGGPLAADETVHPGDAPIAEGDFRRYVPPKALVVDAGLPPQTYPAVPSPIGEIDRLTVSRPRIGYPEAVFAGVDPSTYEPAKLVALINAAHANRTPVDVPDPDVESFDVIVEARAPAHDTGAPGNAQGDLDGRFRVVYSVNVPFTGHPADDESVTLTLDYTDGIDDVATIDVPVAGTTSLPIPTGRDVRLRLLARCRDAADYYGTTPPPVGPYADYTVRRAAATEDALFPDNPPTELSACFLQPGSNLPQLLAQQLGLQQNGLTLSGPAGQRTVFGCSGALRHAIVADGSSITFSNQTELLGHWIVAVTLELGRDWTWDGFIQPATPAGAGFPQTTAPSLSFTRDGAGLPVGAIVMPQVVSPAIFADAAAPIVRSGSQIVFFDAIDPNPAPGRFPAPITTTYTVTATFEAGTTESLTLPITLPITTPPVQTPKIVATGLAESPYSPAADYSSTGLRDRFLWIQLDAPIADTGDDAYFGRVLAYGPDPLLAGELGPTPVPGEMLPDVGEPALPIDPEPIRAVFSGQASDESGLEAMTPVVSAVATGDGTDGTFFMLPLPSGVSAGDLQLFGFWTYEFRVGHRQLWSTARGRFGRPLRVTGIQHAPPALICTVNRTADVIEVTAPYATTVLNGRRVFDPAVGDPQTELWFMLYAQVMQADGASNRNVLLRHVPGQTLGREGAVAAFSGPAGGGDPRAIGLFFEENVLAELTSLGLSRQSSLSVLAVELLPTGQGVRVTVPNAAEDQAGEADPLGADLGTRRILRTSALTALPSLC
jgi:hypothetical protein